MSREMLCIGGPKHGKTITCWGKAYKFCIFDKENEWEHTYLRQEMVVFASDEKIKVLVYDGKKKIEHKNPQDPIDRKEVLKVLDEMLHEEKFKGEDLFTRRLTLHHLRAKVEAIKGE